MTPDEMDKRRLEDLRADPHYVKSMELFREWCRCVARNDNEEIWQICQRYVALANEFALDIRSLRREVISLRHEIEGMEG